MMKPREWTTGAAPVALALVLVTVSPGNGVPAAELTGEEIMQRASDIETPDTAMAKLKMTLINRRGKTRERVLVSFSKKYGDDTKSLIRFKEPADVRGTGFLHWEHQGREDDQFLYLPALKRTRRIAASEKNSSFMGTDFTYQDMQGREVKEDTHTLLGEESLNGVNTYKIESIPKDPEDTQYQKRVSWVRADNFFPVQMELFDRHGKPQKKLTIEKLEKVDGYWTALSTRMANLQKKTQTLIETGKVEMGKPIPDDVFTQRYLEKE